MKPDHASGQTPAPGRRARRWRIAAGTILLTGLIGAGAVYRFGPRAPDFSDDPAMAGFNRAEERQMGELYGKQGQFVEGLSQSLKQPGTQALLIVVAAALVAAGCFHVSRILAEEAKTAAGDGSAESTPTKSGMDKIDGAGR